MIYGYARVSTDKQETDMQLAALNRYGVDEIIQDKGVSGSKRKRPGLDAMLERLVEGDTVVVYKLDRLGRSVSHLVHLAEAFTKNGVAFVSITEGFNTKEPSGKLFFHIMCALAEFERGLIQERVKQGLRTAKEKGVKLGRRRKHDYFQAFIGEGEVPDRTRRYIRAKMREAKPS